jgi:hypothetical protein
MNDAIHYNETSEQSVVDHPGLLRIRPDLTPLAAAGLGIIMVGATVLTVMTGAAAGALVPFVVGLLATSVAYGRLRSPTVAYGRLRSPTVAYGRLRVAPFPPRSARVSISRPLVRRLSTA